MAPRLSVVFCGINPSLYSAAVGHHFARPGNRFWPVLHRSGFTDHEWSPADDARLVEVGLGITNLVARASARAEELSPEELERGAAELAERLRPLSPAAVAVLGLGAYRSAFRRRAQVGVQPESLAGAQLWALPNPSGLQAHYQLADLVEIFAALRASLGRPVPSDGAV